MINKSIFPPLTYGAMYPFRLIWCVLLSVGDAGCTDVCLFTTVMEGTSFVALRQNCQKKYM